jgi:hypothetical protein
MNGSWRTSVEHALLSAIEADGWAADAWANYDGGEFLVQLQDAMNLLSAAKRILAYVDKQSEVEDHLEIIDD